MHKTFINSLGMKEVVSLPPGGVDVIIGNTVITEEDFSALGIDAKLTVFTSERNIARIIVSLGMAKTTSDVRRNRNDLFITFPDDHVGFHMVRMGRYMIAFIVGVD